VEHVQFSDTNKFVERNCKAETFQPEMSEDLHRIEGQDLSR